MPWHGFKIMRHQDAFKVRRQRQNIWISYRFPDHPLRGQEINRRFPVSKTANDRESQIRISQKKRPQADRRSFLPRYLRAFSVRCGGFSFRASSHRWAISAR